jgi:MoaA/NifB/PqqE/SkfB family radical SAM enzyme
MEKKGIPIIYKPWSPKTLLECINAYRDGKIPVLNLDFSAKCSFCSCLYCDSKVGKASLGEMSAQEATSLITEMFYSYGLKWIYICGLGEPTEDPKFFPVLECAKSLGINVSIFTNGAGIDANKAAILKDYPVHIALKLDSLNATTFDTLVGKTGAANKIYKFLDILISSGFLREIDGETNLALSIVPTKLNFMEIKEVINFCKRNKIFPAIGEMEEVNKAASNIDKLSLTRDQLISLKKQISKIIGFEYERPLCPGIIPSLHVTNTGDYVMDQKTGLSCSWFFMKDLNYQVLGNIHHDSLIDVISRMKSHRHENRLMAEMLLKNHKPIFGGGGSQPSKWYKLYLSLLDECPEQKKRGEYSYEQTEFRKKDMFRNIAI